jgi:hypothetical protein
MMKMFTEAEIGRLLVAAKNTRHETLFHLALATGMRQANCWDFNGLIWTGENNLFGLNGNSRRCSRAGITIETIKNFFMMPAYQICAFTIFVILQHH